MWENNTCQFGPTAAFTTVGILHGVDSQRCWKHSSENLVHFDMIGSHTFCKSLLRRIPKVLHWIWIWWLWRPCEYSELNVMLKEQVGDDSRFGTGSVTLCFVVMKGMDVVSNNTQVGCCFNDSHLELRDPKCAKKDLPCYYSTTSLNHWYKAAWIHDFVLFTPNSDSTTRML